MDPIKQIAVEQSAESLALSVSGTERSLSRTEREQFRLLCKQMQAYYPHQEFAPETVDGFLFDLERLSVMHGMGRLRQALLNLRLRPGKLFFPHPSEVSGEIESLLESERRHAQLAREQRERQEDIEYKWKIIRERIEQHGSWTLNGVVYHSLDEVNERDPFLRGTKPVTA